MITVLWFTELYSIAPFFLAVFCEAGYMCMESENFSFKYQYNMLYYTKIFGKKVGKR